MKLVSFAVSTPLGQRQRIGSLAGDDRVIDLQAAYGHLLHASGMTSAAAARNSAALLPDDMTAFIEGGGRGLDAAREAHDRALQAGEATLADGTV
ncbi:MAG: hypothetical protein ACRDJ9_33065, partial [Dehalococcoidia bacterium]